MGASDSKNRFRNVVDPAVASQYRSEGWWGDVTLSDRIASLAASAPDGVAVRTPHGAITWRDYDRQAWRIAHVLVEAGFEPGERLAVMLPDGAAVHVVYLAAERAGITVVGIGSRAGDLEIERILGASEARGLVTVDDAAQAERVSRLGQRVESLTSHVAVPLVELHPDAPVVVDGVAFAGRSSSGAGLDPSIAMGPDDLSMINSTSGTTGLPKCVMHTQNRWMYFHQKAAEFGELGSKGPEVVLSVVPAPFGFGIWTAHFTPALLGAELVVMERFNADLALELIERHRVTLLTCVSTQFMLMMNSDRFGATDLSSLRVMFTGGEAVPYDRAREWEERTSSFVLQFFGSNETGLLSGTRTSDTTEDRLRTCGSVVEEMNVRLFDGDTDVTDTGRGQPGCKGPATSVGYLGDESANRELFTPDGWMLMADECELDGRGFLKVIGRKSDIIIRGGKNISASEVESYVSAHPAVALAAALGAADPIFGERVCVYVQPAVPGTRIELEELVSFMLGKGVSKELLPESLVVMDELPCASGGKVAKGVLRSDLERRLQQVK